MTEPPRFSRETRERFRAIADDLNRFEENLLEYEERFQDRLDPQRRADGKVILRDSARLSVMSAHARARVLMRAIVAAVNAQLPAALFLAARAHVETAGMMAYTLRHCQRFLEGGISSDSLEAKLDRLFLGRTTRLDDGPEDAIPLNEQAIHVHDFVRSTDYLFQAEGRTDLRGAFFEAYEWLSEFCHPNVQARLADHVLEGGACIFLRTPVLTESDLRMSLVHLEMSDFVVSASFLDFEELRNRSWPDESHT